jgi:hypothetical protein
VSAKWKKCAAALLCGAGGLLASHAVQADPDMAYRYNLLFGDRLHPPSARGAVLVYPGKSSMQLVATDSLPTDGSVCDPIPPQGPSPGALLPFSVVKVLDQRTYVPPGAACTSNFAVMPIAWTWYKIIALNDDGSPRRTADGRTIEGWADSADFTQSSNPFELAREARERNGETWCRAGAHKLTAYFGTIWDSKTGEKLPSLGAGKPVEVLGPAWRPGYVNQLCLIRVEGSGDVVMIDASSTVPLGQ